MIVSRRKAKEAAAVGLVVGGLAMLYKVAESVAERRLGLCTLDPPTEALHRDSELLNLFEQLQNYRHVSNKCYVGANVNADRFMKYYTSSLESPSADDMSEMFTYAAKTFDFIEAMVKNAQNPKDSAYIQVIYDSIYEEINTFIGRAMRICYTNGVIVQQNKRNRKVREERKRRRGQKS